MTTDEPVEVFDDGMYERFADSLRDLRTARGWSQEYVAERLLRRGVRDASALMVSRIESKRRRVQLNEAIALSQIFGVPITAFAKQDAMLNTVVLLSDMARQLRRERASFLDHVNEYTDRVRTNAVAIIKIADELREGGQLPADVASHLDRFEWAAGKALAESPAELASTVPWELPAELEVFMEDGEAMVAIPRALVDRLAAAKYLPTDG